MTMLRDDRVRVPNRPLGRPPVGAADSVGAGWPDAPGLTGREDQILELIGQGLTNREIGARLGITEKTVKNTVTSVLAKLGMQRRTQAAAYVAVRGWHRATPVRPLRAAG